MIRINLIDRPPEPTEQPRYIGPYGWGENAEAVVRAEDYGVIPPAIVERALIVRAALERQARHRATKWAYGRSWRMNRRRRANTLDVLDYFNGRRPDCDEFLEI